MTKSDRKQLRDIASRLPVVLETARSGGHYDFVDPEVGGTKSRFVPHEYKVQVNHERRLQTAFKNEGLDGVKKYLESIHELQKQSNAKKTAN